MAERRYVKARDVLPPELLAAVSKALGGRGVYVWVPSAQTLNREDRDRYIVARYEQNYSPEEIADEIFVSVRRVYEVLAEARRKQRSDTGRAESD